MELGTRSDRDELDVDAYEPGRFSSAVFYVLLIGAGLIALGGILRLLAALAPRNGWAGLALVATPLLLVEKTQGLSSRRQRR